VVPLPEKKYIECPDDIYERFEVIVGVTLYEERQIEHIVCWVSEASKAYQFGKEQKYDEAYQTLLPLFEAKEIPAYFEEPCGWKLGQHATGTE
jgi:hypothetical protein